MNKRGDYPRQERLRELFTYDPDTGELRWKVSRGKAKAGSAAGHMRADGYKQVRVDSIGYSLHNICWILAFGSIPDDKTVDHKNRNPSDNRLKNLRLANKRQQEINKLVRGFSWHKWGKRWQAQHRIDGKRKHLGHFKAAILARLAYEREVFRLEPDFACAYFTDALHQLLSSGMTTAWRPGYSEGK